MNKQVEELLGKYSPEIVDLYIRLRNVVYECTGIEVNETLWARLPSYYVGESFVRLIPFKNHINVEAMTVKNHTEELRSYKITPKGMLQIFVGQEVPSEVLKTIIKETLG